MSEKRDWSPQPPTNTGSTRQSQAFGQAPQGVTDQNRAELQSNMQTMVLESNIGSAQSPNIQPDIVFRSTVVRRTGALVWRVSGGLTLHGVTRPVSVEGPVGKTASMLALFASSRRSWRQPIKIGGGVVRVKDELEISFRVYRASRGRDCKGAQRADREKRQEAPLCLICRLPRSSYFISCWWKVRASFCRPLGVTSPDRAAKYRLEWGAVRLMAVPPTSIAGLAGTSRSPTWPLLRCIAEITGYKREERLVLRDAAARFPCCTATVAVLCAANGGDSLLAPRSDALSMTTGNL